MQLEKAKVPRWLSDWLQLQSSSSPQQESTHSMCPDRFNGYWFGSGGPKEESFRVKANKYIQWLFSSMEGVSCVVWLDNFFRPCHIVNPIHGYQTLSCG